MRFDVSSTALLSRLQSISKVIASKNSLPILDSFLFNLEGNTLTVTASDAETRLVTSVDVMNAQGAGLFAVSAKILLDPLKELPEQPLTFDINDENLEIFIHFQNGKYNFIGQKGDTYPQQKPLNDNAISISMDAQMLLNGISRSLFATADDELRPVMNGVYFDIHTDDLTFVASDGHKLVRLRNLAVKSPERASFILPKKPANSPVAFMTTAQGACPPPSRRLFSSSSLTSGVPKYSCAARTNSSLSSALRSSSTSFSVKGRMPRHAVSMTQGSFMATSHSAFSFVSFRRIVSARGFALLPE